MHTAPNHAPLPFQDDAFKAAGYTKDAIAKADPAKLKTLIDYHSIPGYHPIPKGFTSGTPIPTLLKGADLTVILKTASMKGGYTLGNATVRDAAGGDGSKGVICFACGLKGLGILDTL